MKIAFLVKTFPSLSETFILNQITGLIEQGHDVDIYALEKGDSEKIHPNVDKYQLLRRTYYQPNFPKNCFLRLLKGIIIFLSCPPHCFFYLIKCLNFFKYGKQAISLRLLYSTVPFTLYKTKKYDIFHCHFAGAGLRGITIKKIVGLDAKVLTTFHGYDLNAFNFVQSNNFKYLFGEGDLFTVGSNFMLKKALSLGCPENKIFRLPMGIDLENYDFRVRTLSKDEPIKLLTVARLVEKKGIEYSIQSVARVAKIHPNLQYRVVGEGPQRIVLEQLIEDLNISQHVKLLGWKTKDEVKRLYDDSHIFILSSVTAANGDKEGQGLVLQEAQSMGLPVLATNHNGFPDSIQDKVSGFLVPERDIDALEERLLYLIENPDLWLTMGKAGRSFVEERFDHQKLTEKLIAIYEKTLNGSS